MVDNVEITAGSGTIIATDEISTVHYQLVKINLGALNANDGPVSATNPLPIVKKSLTPTLSNVAASATSVTVLAANTARLGAIIFNDSTSIAYIKFGATASATSFVVKMQPGDYYEVPYGYTGIITGIWVAATGSARVTELT